MQETGNPRPTSTETRELAAAADELFFAVRKARSTGADTDGGLSLPQLYLLEPLAAEPSQPVSHLAAAADVSIPTATRMLQQLETAGVVVRRRSPEDERKVLVSLTSEGSQRLERLLARRRARQARAFSTFSPRERKQLVGLLRRLTTAMKELEETEPG